MRREVARIKNGYIAETAHSMEKSEQAFRLIVIRRPYQGPLFTKEDTRLNYTVIASNRIESPEDVVASYNHRGEYSENQIKELKIGYGMERMPFGQLKASAIFFRIGTLAYDLFPLFVLKTLSPSWHQHQVPLGSTWIKR